MGWQNFHSLLSLSSVRAISIRHMNLVIAVTAPNGARTSAGGCWSKNYICLVTINDCVLPLLAEWCRSKSLQRRHNGHDGVSNHPRLDCLLNPLFRRRSKKTSICASLALVRGIHRSPVNSPHKVPVTRKYFHLMTSSCGRWIILNSRGTQCYRNIWPTNDIIYNWAEDQCSLLLIIRLSHRWITPQKGHGRHYRKCINAQIHKGTTFPLYYLKEYAYVFTGSN